MLKEGESPRVGLGLCLVSQLGGFVPLLWWMELDFVSLKGGAVSSNVFWGVYGLDMALGSPANGQGCVFILEMVQREVSRTEGFGSLGGTLS